MSQEQKMSQTSSFWFVGAVHGKDGDQTKRFLTDGIWENGYSDKYLKQVRDIQLGDQIAIKSSYTRKHNLPFNNRNQTVSVMAIKASGTVLANRHDGKKITVDWTPLEPQLEWYFYTNRRTIWRLNIDDWRSKALIEFTFDGRNQDLSRFMNSKQLINRFGDSLANE